MAYTVLPGGDKGFTVTSTRKTVIGMETNTDYTFAGWFYTPCGSKAGHEMDWTEENNVGATDLFQSHKVQNQRIYAYWIDAGYSQAQIGYWTDAVTHGRSTSMPQYRMTYSSTMVLWSLPQLQKRTRPA